MYVLRNLLKNGKPTPGINYFADYWPDRDRFLIVADWATARQFPTKAKAEEFLTQTLPAPYRARWDPVEIKA